MTKCVKEYQILSFVTNSMKLTFYDLFNNNVDFTIFFDYLHVSNFSISCLITYYNFHACKYSCFMLIFLYIIVFMFIYILLLYDGGGGRGGVGGEGPWSEWRWW